MTAAEITALLVDGHSEDANAVLQSLAPEISFSESDFTNSIHKAIVSHSESNFHVCFIAESFPLAELQTFFNDVQRIGKDKSCVFIQVRSEVPADFDRSSLASLGFTTVITRKGGFADKEAVKEALKHYHHSHEVVVRKADVRRAMRMLLREIDRTAADHRRGFHHKMTAIPVTGIACDTEFDSEVLLTYFLELERESEISKPRTIEKLDVPDNVLKKKLPKLSKDGYTGTSYRVWELLANKHGVKVNGEHVKEAASQTGTPPPSEASHPEIESLFIDSEPETTPPPQIDNDSSKEK